jgi:DNA-binding MarR family transcriptional regulator
MSMKTQVKEEASPRKPAANTTEREVFLQVQRTADWLMRDLEELLKPAGLSATQYNVLRILRGGGSSGLACHQIAEQMLTRDPDMTRLLDRLEQRALISRTRESSDRRVIRTCITPEGMKLLKRLDEPVRALHRRQLSHLGGARLKQLAQLLDAAREA